MNYVKEMREEAAKRLGLSVIPEGAMYSIWSDPNRYGRRLFSGDAATVAAFLDGYEKGRAS